MVATIAELPFHLTPPDDLLGIDWGRPGFVDDDHVGFGYGPVSRLLLRSPADSQLLRDPMVLALHSADRPPQTPSDAPFDLELDVGDERLHIPLDRFLDVWIPRLPHASDLVLALCNPGAFAIARPPRLAAATRFWYALSDVDSHAEALDSASHSTTYGLTAHQWVCLR